MQLTRKTRARVAETGPSPDRVQDSSLSSRTAIRRNNQTNRIFSFPERSGCSHDARSRSPFEGWWTRWDSNPPAVWKQRSFAVQPGLPRYSKERKGILSAPLLPLRKFACFDPLRTAVSCRGTDLLFQLLQPRSSASFFAAASFGAHPVTCRAMRHSLGTARRRSFPLLNLHSARVRRNRGRLPSSRCIESAQAHRALCTAC